MPRARSPNRDEAKRLWLESGKTRQLKDIAAELGVSPDQVRKWKKEDNWEGNAKGHVTKKGNSHVTKPKQTRGAPHGNKNAVGNKGGNGGPLRNQNALKHGVYAGVFWDRLDEKEALLVEHLPTDEEQHLLDEIALLSIRERRLLDKITHIQQQDELSRGLMIDEVLRTENKREFESEADRQLYDERQRTKIDNEEILPGRPYQISTRTKDNSDLLLRAHGELTRVQAQKRQCIETLNKVRLSREPTSKANPIAEAWIAAMIEGDDDG